jgi:nitrogen fixation-related uncharacterized protein
VPFIGLLNGQNDDLYTTAIRILFDETEIEEIRKDDDKA